MADPRFLYTKGIEMAEWGKFLEPTHRDEVFFDEEPGENTCVCADGSVGCNVEGCDNWADICQGMDTCWEHYEDKKE